MDSKTIYGIIAVFSMLVGVGGQTMLNPDMIDKTYVCTINENVGVFDHLSSTAKTGYYLDASNVQKSKTCVGGQWVSIKAYAASKGINIYDILNNEQSNKIKSYSCSVDGNCYPNN